jgi:hypothetical protein
MLHGSFRLPRPSGVRGKEHRDPEAGPEQLLGGNRTQALVKEDGGEARAGPIGQRAGGYLFQRGHDSVPMFRYEPDHWFPTCRVGFRFSPSVFPFDYRYRGAPHSSLRLPRMILCRTPELVVKVG